MAEQKSFNRIPPTLVRRHPAHPAPVTRARWPVILFVTLCIKPRVPALANPRFQTAFLGAVSEATQWAVGYYLLMPDHIHLFAAPTRQESEPVSDWASFLKKRIRRHLGASQWKWLPDCWDTQMRDERHYAEKLDYVRHNPVRAQLVSFATEWPHQGVIEKSV